MPNETRNKTGRTLREQLKAAAEATAEEQRARNSVSRGEKTRSSKAKDRAKDAPKESKNNKAATKRRLSKEQAKEKSTKESRREESAKGRSLRVKIMEFIGNLNLAYKIIALVVVVILAIGFIMYPIGCTYYQALRTEQKLQAELDAVNERNSAIEGENKELETNEGVENQARQEYGWVKDGENATVVTNGDDKDASGDMPSQVDSSQIEPPHTWYYDILDIVFQSEV